MLSPLVSARRSTFSFTFFAAADVPAVANRPPPVTSVVTSNARTRRRLLTGFPPSVDAGRPEAPGVPVAVAQCIARSRAHLTPRQVDPSRGREGPGTGPLRGRRSA